MFLTLSMIATTALDNYINLCILLNMQERYYRVDMLESEAGWGSRTDDSFYYKTKEAASKFVKEYNDKYNNKPVTPSWYIVACTPEEINDFSTVDRLNKYFEKYPDKEYCNRDTLRTVVAAQDW